MSALQAVAAGSGTATRDAQAVLLGLARGEDEYRTLLLVSEGDTLRLEGSIPELVVPVAEELCPLLIRPLGTSRAYVAAALGCSTREPPRPPVPSGDDCDGHDRVGMTFVGPEHLSITVSSETECSGRINVNLDRMVLPLAALRDRWLFDWSAAPVLSAESVFAQPDLTLFRRAQLERCDTLDAEDRPYLRLGGCAALPAASPDGYSPSWAVARGQGRWEVWDTIEGWRYKEWPYRVPVSLPATIAGSERLPVSWDAIERTVPGAVDAMASADARSLAILSASGLQVAAASGGKLSPGSPVTTISINDRIVMARAAEGQRAIRWCAIFRRLLAERAR